MSCSFFLSTHFYSTLTRPHPPPPFCAVVQQNGGQPPSFEEYITLELHSALEAHAERPTRMAGAWPWTVAAVEKGKGGQQQAT